MGWFGGKHHYFRKHPNTILGIRVFFWGGKAHQSSWEKKKHWVCHRHFLKLHQSAEQKKTVGSSSTASAIQKLFGHVLFKMLFSLSFLNIALALGLAWWFGCSLKPYIPPHKKKKKPEHHEEVPINGVTSQTGILDVWVWFLQIPSHQLNN